MRVQTWLSRDRLAVVAALAAPLLLTVILVPFRTSFPYLANPHSGSNPWKLNPNPVR